MNSISSGEVARFNLINNRVINLSTSRRQGLQEPLSEKGLKGGKRSAG
jgi:hypothetical protein